MISTLIQKKLKMNLVQRIDGGQQDEKKEEENFASYNWSIRYN
jgi:hypothetical protein